MCRAILSHANYAGVARETPMETPYAVDELSDLPRLWHMSVVEERA